MSSLSSSCRGSPKATVPGRSHSGTRSCPGVGASHSPAIGNGVGAAILPLVDMKPTQQFTYCDNFHPITDRTSMDFLPKPLQKQPGLTDQCRFRSRRRTIRKVSVALTSSIRTSIADTVSETSHSVLPAVSFRHCIHQCVVSKKSHSFLNDKYMVPTLHQPRNQPYHQFGS